MNKILKHNLLDPSISKINEICNLRARIKRFLALCCLTILYLSEWHQVIIMNPICFDHIHFTVTDIEAGISFYRKLGFTDVSRINHDGESVQMRTPNRKLTIDIHNAKATDNPGFNHFAMSVENLEEVAKELKGFGIAVDGPVNVKATGRKLATIRDPNGFLVQLVEKP